MCDGGYNACIISVKMLIFHLVINLLYQCNTVLIQQYVFLCSCSWVSKGGIEVVGNADNGEAEVGSGRQVSNQEV